MCSSSTLKEIEAILDKPGLDRDDLRLLIGATDPAADELIRSRAYAVKRERVGTQVYLRGLVEVSNHCRKNCLYCGIRRDNDGIRRFEMTQDEILECALWADRNHYASIVLQAGEQTSERFVGKVEETLRAIRQATQGRLGVTLSLGEQDPRTYERWFAQGAHRYLLRIETSNPELYSRLHPADHSFERRLECLAELRRIGYQVGTGVMIGLPGQSFDDLVEDLLFFKRQDVDMIGMGPYVLSARTPLAGLAIDGPEERDRRFKLALRMISLCRILMPDINIASTTALQALHPMGREMGLMAGANILMPVITGTEHRKDYLLYDGKPCLDDAATKCRLCLEARIRGLGETIGYGQWGDSPRARARANGAW